MDIEQAVFDEHIGTVKNALWEIAQALEAAWSAESGALKNALEEVPDGPLKAAARAECDSRIEALRQQLADFGTLLDGIAEMLRESYNQTASGPRTYEVNRQAMRDVNALLRKWGAIGGR